jgi:hypothetical protein
MYILKQYFYDRYEEEVAVAVGKSLEVLVAYHDVEMVKSDWWIRKGHPIVVTTEEGHEVLRELEKCHYAIEEIREVV